MVPAQHDLAMAHLTTPALPKDIPSSRDHVLVRFDGLTLGNGDPVIFAMITAEALAKVPASTMRGLGMLVRTEDGGLHGSPHAFFRQTPAGVSLYVDTDVHEDFLGRFVDACQDGGIEPLLARGDINLLCGENMDVDPPPSAAFMENGFEPVPVRRALETVHELRARFEAGRPAAQPAENDGDDPVSPCL